MLDGFVRVKNKHKKIQVDFLVKWTLIIAFVIIIVPLFVLSLFSHPVFDDYANTAEMHLLYAINGGSLLSVMKSPFLRVIDVYYSWQGTYSAVFLFALQPGVWSESSYFLTTFVIIGSLVFSTLYFWKAIIVKFMHGDKNIAYIITFLILIYQVLYVPYISDAFYWYVGSIFYSFFYSLSLIQVGLLISLCASDSKKEKCKYMVLNCALIFFIEGGNYSTALVNILIVLFVCFLDVFFKKGNIRYYAPVFIIGMTGLLLSVLAPGNAGRESTVGIETTPVWSIFKSFKYAGSSIVTWTHLHQIGLFIILMIVALSVLKNVAFDFKFPGFFVIICFCLFSAQITPLYYGAGAAGSPRNIVIYYYSYYILMSVSLLYLEGWAVKRISKLPSVRLLIVSSAVVALLIIISVLRFGPESTSSYLAYSDLRSGRAAAYDDDYKKMVRTIENAREKEGASAVVDIRDSGNWTYCLYPVLEYDEHSWVNSSIARYYGIKMINYHK